MSNKTQLQTNNTNLASYTDRVTALIDVANSLPESGGSGGASVDTCTVEIFIYGFTTFISYLTVENGVVVPRHECYHGESVEITVLCGSLLCLEDSLSELTYSSAVTTGGITHVLCDTDTNVFEAFYINGNGTIDFPA